MLRSSYSTDNAWQHVHRGITARMRLVRLVFLLATPALPPLPAKVAPTIISLTPPVFRIVLLDITKIQQAYSARLVYLAVKLATLALPVLPATLAVSTQGIVSRLVQLYNTSSKLPTLLNAVACNASILVILAAMNPLV